MNLRKPGARASISRSQADLVTVHKSIALKRVFILLDMRGHTQYPTSGALSQPKGTFAGGWHDDTREIILIVRKWFRRNFSALNKRYPLCSLVKLVY